MEKLKMHTPDLTQDNIACIRELLPSCVTEAKDNQGNLKLAIDFDQLRQELSGQIVEGPQERYHLNWPGKREALLTANSPIAKTLRPARDESVDFDTTKNLFIEGDNLDALKLLQETYLGKVKMIYIDPPYNTGNDFIYEDDFTADAEEFLICSNQKDEQGNRLVANTENNGRFHSDWLSMLYPRLKLARNLLSEDGVIFISIDNSEHANLQKICDEVFGRNNFASSFVIKSNPRGSQSNGFSASVHEILLCYVKNSMSSPGFEIPLSDDMVSEYKLEDKDGKYRLLGLRLRGGSWRREQRPLLFYPIYVDTKTGRVSLTKSSDFSIETLPIQPSTNEEGTWRWSKQKLQNDIDMVIAKEVRRDSSTVWDIFQKDYLSSKEGEQKGTKPKTIWDEREVNYQNGTAEVKGLFSKGVFNFPKPVCLLKKTIQIAAKKDSIILDFFAGSSTTAHAVMQLNAEDGGNRKFIMAQLPEPCDEKSEAFKAGYKTISKISKERIRRAGKKILEGGWHENWDKDIGFRILKIDSSNMADIYYMPDALDQKDLLTAVDNIKQDRDNPEDLLFQVLLDWGVDLTLPIHKKTVKDKTIFFVNHEPYDLIACFDDGVTEELMKELAGHKPLRVIFRDNAFISDAVKINVEQIFKQLSPGTDVKSI